MRINETQIRQIVLGDRGYLVRMNDSGDVEVGYSSENVRGLIDIANRLNIDIV